jgi:hypothetical protein
MAACASISSARQPCWLTPPYAAVAGPWSAAVADISIAAVLVQVFMISAGHLARDASSRLWLGISGWTCAVFTVIAVFAFSTSFSQPVDVDCAIWSAIQASVMGMAAWRQLWLWFKPSPPTPGA